MGRVLIIDDDEMMCKAMSTLIKREGHDACYSATLQSGLEIAATEAFDIVFLDVLMPDGNGLELVSKIRETSSTPEVIIMTAAGDPDSAEIAIKSGAWDYLEKKSSLKEMMLPLSRAFQYRQQKLSRRTPIALKREKIIGKSPKIKACLDLLAQAAASDTNVLLCGETGTGKELFARAIHNNSIRNGNHSLEPKNSGNVAQECRNFVVVDCTALPETLVESVLFGHVKGAFTGADKDQEGLIKQADGGTLFLDEIGELPLNIQKAFLRVLQERRYRPVGGKKEIESNFRLIAATNRNLDHMVEEGIFRKDLLFRLRSLSVELPLLRERPEDIDDLARFHVKRLCDRYGIETKGFSADFFEALKSYDWPGNVRELVNTLDGALAVAGDDPILFSKHLPIHIRIDLARASVSKKDASHATLSYDPKMNGTFPKLRDFRNSLEKKYLQDLISHVKRDIHLACQLSGLSRSRLYELLSVHNVSISNH